MRIHLRASFDHGENELETESRTLRELLLELSRKYPKVKFYNKERNEVCFNFFVELNGQMYDTLPDELDTELKDGDTVEIYAGADYPED